MRVLDRYLLREVGQTWLAVTLILLAILVSNQFARILGDAAAGELPRDAVFTLLGLTSLNYLTILVPVSLFLSVMLALGRLYKDSEMAALTACGVGPMQVYRPLLAMTLALASLLAVLSLFIAPWALRQVDALKDTARQEAEISSLQAGQFRSSGGIVFYAEGVTADGRLRNVFLERRRGDSVEAVVAATAEQKTDMSRGLRVMVLYDGRRYEGVPGEPGFRIMDFEEHGIPIALSAREADEPDLEAQPFAALLSQDGPAASAELHWRLSAPFSVLMLVLLAVPLSKIDPRQGRYGKFAIAILVYIAYANLLGAGRVWLEQGQVPGFVGLWWIHGALVAFAGWLLWRIYGRRRIGNGVST